MDGGESTDQDLGHSTRPAYTWCSAVSSQPEGNIVTCEVKLSSGDIQLVTYGVVL